MNYEFQFSLLFSFSCLSVSILLINFSGRLFVVQCRRFVHTPKSLTLSTMHMAIQSEHKTGKAGRTQWKKWEGGLTRKIRRAELGKWEGLTPKMGWSDWKNEKDWPPKNGKAWLEKSKSPSHFLVRSPQVLGKSGKDWLEEWEALTR